MYTYNVCVSVQKTAMLYTVIDNRGCFPKFANMLHRILWEDLNKKSEKPEIMDGINNMPC